MLVKILGLVRKNKNFLICCVYFLSFCFCLKAANSRSDAISSLSCSSAKGYSANGYFLIFLTEKVVIEINPAMNRRTYFSASRIDFVSDIVDKLKVGIGFEEYLVSAAFFKFGGD